ncbi:polyribonucleotide nucleotidyltransferase [Candidatus Parcubacteria bacterium]|nr:MAG: polyribonucleotide nucleotidyltransferase [Candidatus Parcubacteria bacterium]
MEAAVFHSQIAGEGGLASLKEELRAHLEARIKEGALPPDTNLKNADLLFEDAVDAFVHKSILEEERRPDGRKLDEVRQLEGAVGIFSRNHGSAIFVRGSTQAFAVTTLAPPGAEQLIETMEMSGKRRFMLHYNFPAYSVGEIGAFRSPGRREIGHGALAEKAVKYVLPPQEKFPYTIRVVSEILSSNGSSSMATVCAGTLSLMDAGVPIARPVAGIAMGLMKDEKGNYKILTDIQGPEDHHGDMDFKVAGTERGITAIQMDVKVEGVPHKILREALVQAKKARNEILSFMRTVIAAPRPQLSPLVPKIVRLHIDPDKIGLVIGAGGKTINSLIAKTGVQSIDLEEDGSVYIAADDMEKAHAAAKEIEMMTKEFHEGDIVEGRVSKILDFGAIVDLGGGQDGMVHVSELKNGYVKEVSDVVKEGDVVKAKVIKVDPATGRIGLSLKRLDAEHGKKSRHTQ